LSAPRPGRFTPGNDPVPIVQEAGWALSGRVPKISPPPGFDPRTVQPVSSRFIIIILTIIVAFQERMWYVELSTVRCHLSTFIFYAPRFRVDGLTHILVLDHESSVPV
jgi:hypothetical protein